MSWLSSNSYHYKIREERIVINRSAQMQILVPCQGWFGQRAYEASGDQPWEASVPAQFLLSLQEPRLSSMHLSALPSLARRTFFS